MRPKSNPPKRSNTARIGGCTVPRLIYFMNVIRSIRVAMRDHVRRPIALAIGKVLLARRLVPVPWLVVVDSVAAHVPELHEPAFRTSDVNASFSIANVIRTCVVAVELQRSWIQSIVTTGS
jgi:hypothetical protein